jgi:hypothetical protein
MSYEKKYILIFDSSLKYERRVVVLQVRDMPGELSFSSLRYERRNVVLEFGVWEESYRFSILRYERRVVVRWVWNIPCKLCVFKFEVCQKSCRSSSLRNVSLLNFVANFVPTIAVNWLFDNNQWNNIVINTTGVAYEAGHAHPTRALEFTHSFSCVRA